MARSTTIVSPAFARGWLWLLVGATLAVVIATPLRTSADSQALLSEQNQLEENLSEFELDETDPLLAPVEVEPHYPSVGHLSDHVWGKLLTHPANVFSSHLHRGPPLG